jgi:hypothetical protein
MIRYIGIYPLTNSAVRLEENEEKCVTYQIEELQGAQLIRRQPLQRKYHLRNKPKLIKEEEHNQMSFDMIVRYKDIVHGVKW